MFKINNTDYKLLTTTVNEVTNDALISFLNKDMNIMLNKTTKDFYNALGPDDLKNMYNYHNTIDYNVAYTFPPGFLDYDVLINCVVPNDITNNKLWAKLFDNLELLLKTYKQNYPLNKITIHLPIINEEIVDLFLNSLKDIGIKQVNLLVIDDVSYKQLHVFLNKRKDNHIINKFLDKIIEKIAKIL